MTRSLSSASSRYAAGVLTCALVAGLFAAPAFSESGTSQEAVAASISSAPSTPPAAVCGNAGILNGPATPPPGAVRIDSGQDLAAATNARGSGTTFWLAPGTHTLANVAAAVIQPKAGNVYVGAPGAVLDGKRINLYAFGGTAGGVTLRHLTIQNFGPVGGNWDRSVVNANAAVGWLIERSTIRSNAGAGILLSSNNTARYNCIANNGQYGVSAYKPDGPKQITLDHNEITGNNADGWETRKPGCGCSGGTKFWKVVGAALTNNWVHHNKGSGLWPDSNNVDFRIEGNYINDNDAEGIFYEISYNAVIRNNTLRRNGLVKGAKVPYPVAAILIAESGGDSRVSGSYSTLEITGNVFEDNWGGVMLWEDANRFCGSTASVSYGCTLGGAATTSTCVAGTINNPPYFADCRWKTQNVWVHDNDFRIDKAAVGCTTSTLCGRNSIFASLGSAPNWSPYLGRTIQEAITYKQNNRFTNNRYVGDWRFSAYDGRVLSAAAWRAAPYLQDGADPVGTPPTSPPAGATASPSPSATSVATPTAPISGAPSPTVGPTGATTATTLAFAGVRPDGARIHLRWRNPTATDWARTVIRRSTGTRAPATVASGVAVYAGRGTRAADRVRPGRTYRYAAFSYDSAGRVTRTVAPRAVTAIARPALSVADPTSARSRGLPFRVRWTADSADSYRVQYTSRVKRDGKWVLRPWTDWKASAGRSTAIFSPGSQGRTLYFRALARDSFGNPTPYTRAKRAVVPLDDNSPALRYSSSWSPRKHADRWLGSEQVTRRQGATVSLRSAASAFVIVGTRCATCGTFEVYLDGALHATVDTSAPTTRVRRVLYRVSLGGGIQPHRLTVKALGTSERPWMRIDAIAVIR